MDCLWPDAYGDAAHSAFATTLSRLRRLMGIEGAIRFREGKLSLDPHYCWVDAQAFERILARFEKKLAAPGTTEKSLLELVEKAAGLYRGHFLPADEEQFWTISYRERLRSRFSRMINKAGDWLQKTGKWEKAAEYYRKGLDIDDLSEEFYQNLMICLQHLGRHANAIEVYRRCRKLLSTKLGIEPSAKTKTIYSKITGA